MTKTRKNFFKNKQQTLLFFGVVILAVGFLSYDNYSKKQLAREDAIETFEENIPVQCENGKWIEFPELLNSSQLEKFASSERLSYDEKNNIFVGEKNKETFSTDADYSLSFFLGRDVLVEGYRLNSNAVYIRRIQCSGVEADRVIVSDRKVLMNYIKDNINTLALEKAPKNDWQVETYYFINDTDLYVQYETSGSFMEEAPYDSHLWLIRVSSGKSGAPAIKTLAYIEEDVEDSQKNVVKQGVDIYREAKNLTIYEFDADSGQWTLQ